MGLTLQVVVTTINNESSLGPLRFYFRRFGWIVIPCWWKDFRCFHVNSVGNRKSEENVYFSLNLARNCVSGGKLCVGTVFITN